MSGSRRLAPGVERVVGDTALVEVAVDGPIAILRAEAGGRDIAVLHQRAPDVAELLELLDRLAWLDGRCHAPRVLASGRSADGDESAVIRLVAGAVDAATAGLPLPPEAVAVRLGEALRVVHAEPVDGLPFDASTATLRDRAAARVGSGSVPVTETGAYGGREPGALLAVLDGVLDGLEPTPAARCLIHGRPTVDQVWFAPDGSVVLTGWGEAGAGDPHHDVAVAAASLVERYGPAVVAPMLDAYGLDRIDLRRLDAHQLLAHLLGRVR